MAGSYFPHDSNARNDSKILRLRMKYGAEGYGIYFMLLERLREEPDYTSVKDYNIIAFDFRVSADKVKSIIEDFGLFAFTENGERFYSEELKGKMEIKDEAARRKSEGGKKGMSSRYAGNQPINNAVIANLRDSYNIVTTNLKDSCNKKSKEKKSKENLKENAFGVKEKPETAAEQEPEIPEGSFPDAGLEGCESFPVEAGNLSKKEIPGGAAQNPGCGGVSSGGTGKPPGGTREPRSIEENIRICQSSASWLESVAMQNGMTVEGVKAELAKFPEHLTAYGHDEPKPLNDFKAHFNNYLRIRKKDADDSAKARGARKGTGEAAAGGMGSGAERPRPKPLF